jgi:hypothetical protein
MLKCVDDKLCYVEVTITKCESDTANDDTDTFWWWWSENDEDGGEYYINSYSVWVFDYKWWEISVVWSEAVWCVMTEEATFWLFNSTISNMKVIPNLKKPFHGRAWRDWLLPRWCCVCPSWWPVKPAADNLVWRDVLNVKRRYTCEAQRIEMSLSRRWWSGEEADEAWAITLIDWR